MLRQLARLTRPVDGVAGAVAIAVYADARDVSIPARERGREGVACVDDAARALTLLCDLWEAARPPFARAWARGLLEFLLSMQDGDGRFVNFIADWSGRQNLRGPTSVAGGGFWQARGVRALAKAARTFDDARIRAGITRGLRHLREDPAPADVRAIQILAAVELLRAERTPELVADLEAWCAELVACRREGILFDNPDESAPHLWAHLQEAALAEAGAYLARSDLVAVARESALRYLAPIVDSGFALPTVQPDGVASALAGLERLASITGEPRFAQLVPRARAWFDVRNPAGRPVYDRIAGRVHDGIDGAVLNAHSGAESNIAGARALFPELPRIAATQRAVIEADLPAAVHSFGEPLQPGPRAVVPHLIR